MARKKIVRPTPAEQRKITARLKHKYPQMYETTMTKYEKAAIKDLVAADRKALERMVGKKLKKLYRSK
ncbi:hypothetical protein KA005_72010 [bacterium]|nr:hypothetical protein [bacterium]